MTDPKVLGAAIYDAEKNRQPIAPFTTTHPDITADEAYAAQLQYVSQRQAGGATVRGKKIGLTSQAMQNMLGVDRPDYGHIFDDMIFDEHTPIDTSNYIAPRVEFEIALVLNETIDGESATLESVSEAIDYVVPAAELIDSRIKDWKIKFEDTVSDNGSSAGAVIGRQQTRLENVDLPAVQMTVFKNGESTDTGYGSAVLGHPLEAVVWLARELAAYGISLSAGEVVLAGALTKAVPVESGDQFKAVFDGLGEVEASFS